MNPLPAAYIAFNGNHRIAAGDLREVARTARQTLDRHPEAALLIFDGASSEPVDLDFRGTVDEVVARLPATAGIEPDSTETEMPANRGPGRPKLGVVAREVTLLPRHWDWLAQQSGGASVVIRKLVDEARRSGDDKTRIRRSQEAAYRFMSAMAGNQPHFEEASRALFAPNPSRFKELIAGWPTDVRDHAADLAARSFPAITEPG